MFERLHTKLKYYIVVSVIAFASIMFLSITIYTNHVLLKDVKLKTTLLSEQYSSSVATQLERIVKAKTLFEAKNNVVSVIKSQKQDTNLSANLSELVYSISAVVGGAIITPDKMYYRDVALSPDTLAEMFSLDVSELYDYLSENVKEPTWVFREISVSRHVELTKGLFHVSPIMDGDKLLGMFLVLCDVDQMLADFHFEDSSFLGKCNVYLYDESAYTMPVYQYTKKDEFEERIADAIPQNEHQVANISSLMIYNKITNSNIGLAVYFPTKYAIFKNTATNVLMALSFCGIIILCICTQKKFILGITIPLTQLLNKMNKYINDKKVKEGNDGQSS